LMLIFDIFCFEPMIINSVMESFIKRRLESIQARMSAIQFQYSLVQHLAIKMYPAETNDKSGCHLHTYVHWEDVYR
jgi:hypothetical protein